MASKPINVEKLRSLGVPEEVIATLDPRDGGNITPQGEVLFLDEERQASKEHPERPMRKNHPNGLGIKNALAHKLASSDKTKPGPDGEPPVKMFQIIVDAASWPEDSIKGKIFQKMLGMDEKGYSCGTVMPLNHNLSEDSTAGVIPIDLVYSYLEDAEYIAILKVCVCRQVFDCKDYPIDLGCIFLNAAGRHAVENGIADKATVEEAKAHVQRAKKAGLVANAELQEMEQLIWGLRNDEMNEFRMLCFCCPCCCTAFKVVQAGSQRVKDRYSSCGYTTTVDHDKCVGCHKCQSVCPKQAISYREDGKCVIDQDNCFGCGFCKEECAVGALTLQQTFPMRENVDEYFMKEHRIDDGFTYNKAVKHEDR